jgi:ATP-dependent Lon protease
MAKMDKELYGMKYVKEQLMVLLNSKLRNPDMTGCSIGLVGSPGVGKTSIAKCLAKLLDYPFEQIQFGGVTSADFLRGHDYTYVGACPGEIVKCLSRMKYKNGILFLDEFDKISESKEIVSSLLHITDPVHNTEFVDNFISPIKVDLSKLWFIYSMNKLPENNALQDRIFAIHVPGYTQYEKVRIVIDHIFPKSLKNIGHHPSDIRVSIKIAMYLIHKIDTGEEGVRTLEKYIKDIVSKIFFISSNMKQNSPKCFTGMSFFKHDVSFPCTLTENIIDLCVSI